MELKEKIRGFVLDYGDNNPYPQTSQKQYEWWISCIEAWTNHVREVHKNYRLMVKEDLENVEKLARHLHQEIDMQLPY